MRIHLLVLLFCCLCLSSLLPAFSTSAFHQLERDHIHIYYAKADSQYAQRAVRTLNSAFEEITYDLQIKEFKNIHVFIVPSRQEFRQSLQGRLPEWTGAYAIPSEGRMVVKSPRWSAEDNFQSTLVHELFHLLVHSYLGVQQLPRWMDEGLAIFYSRETAWTTSTALSKAMATNSVIPLSDIDYVLEYHRAKADLAYQQSYSAVKYLLRTYDIEAIRKILQGLKQGKSLDQCFIAATGSPFTTFENEWKAHVEKTHKWFWFYEIDQYIWIFVFVLFFVVLILRKLRNRRIVNQWLEEDVEEPDEEQREI